MSTVDRRVRNPYPFTGIDFTSAASSRVSLWLHDGPRDQIWYTDEQAGLRAVEIFPQLRETAGLERAFADHAVRFCLARGVRQFLVIGCGLPSEPMVHQIAEQSGCPSRCVYVDVEPVTVAHTTLAVEDSGTLGLHSVFHADLRAPDYIWRQAVAAKRKSSAPTTTAVLDGDLPIAIILPWVLPYAGQDDELCEALSRLKALVASGSLLIASHTTSDGVPDTQARELAGLQEHFATVNMPIVYRNRAAFTRFFDGLDLVDPAVTWAPRWLSADDPVSRLWANDPAACCTLAAIGVKP